MVRTSHQSCNSTHRTGECLDDWPTQPTIFCRQISHASPLLVEWEKYMNNFSGRPLQRLLILDPSASAKSLTKDIIEGLRIRLGEANLMQDGSGCRQRAAFLPWYCCEHQCEMSCSRPRFAVQRDTHSADAAPTHIRRDLSPGIDYGDASEVSGGRWAAAKSWNAVVEPGVSLRCCCRKEPRSPRLT